MANERHAVHSEWRVGSDALPARLYGHTIKPSKKTTRGAP